jgi:hypothetical protein
MNMDEILDGTVLHGLTGVDRTREKTGMVGPTIG